MPSLAEWHCLGHMQRDQAVLLAQDIIKYIVIDWVILTGVFFRYILPTIKALYPTLCARRLIFSVTCPVARISKTRRFSEFQILLETLHLVGTIRLAVAIVRSACLAGRSWQRGKGVVFSHNGDYSRGVVHVY